MPHISLEVPARPVEVKRELVRQMTKLVSELYEIPEGN
jgi:phenylpyruvate tautomerase PptA (4-oxalocrotonate tautomerase family)